MLSCTAGKAANCVPSKLSTNPDLSRFPAPPGGEVGADERHLGAALLLPVRAPDSPQTELRRSNFGGKFQNLPG